MNDNSSVEKKQKSLIFAVQIPSLRPQVSLRNAPIRSAKSRRTATGRLIGLCKLAIFVIIAGAAGWFALHQTVQTQLRDQIQSKVSQKLLGTGLVAKVGQARFNEGQGIQLNNVSLHLDIPGSTQTHGPRSSLEVYEAVLRAPASIAELVATELDVQSIELRRAQLTVVRNRNGQWDFEPILASLANLKPETDSPIPVALTDCEIRIIDQANSRRRPISLNHVNIFIQPITHEGRPLLQINGGFQSAAISQIEFTTFLDQQAQTWHAKLAATEAVLSSDLISALPPSLKAEFNGLESLFGKINLSAIATGSMSLDDIPRFEVKGGVSDVSVSDDRLPFRISRLSGGFVVNNHGFAIENLTGNLDQGNFAVNYSQRGLLERQQWHVDGFVNDFDFDNTERLQRWLPASCKKFCKQYSPRGTSNLRFDITHDGTTLKRDLTGDLTNMSFSFIDMPYMVENCRGKVRWVDDYCEFRVDSLTNKQIIKFDGFARDLGKPSATFQVNISVPGDLPIDQKMLDAVDAKPKMAKIIREFNPTGRVGGTGTIEKREPHGELIKTFDVRLKNVSIRHNGFNYPIDKVRGLIHIENMNYTFSQLTGASGKGTVDCDGTWDPVNGLDVRFLCSSVPLNDQLRYALKPNIREIWDGFRPRGTLDNLSVDMTLPIGSKDVDIVVDAHMKKPNDVAQPNYVSIHPTWFPYQINHVTGQFNIGKGKIKLTGVQGKHQRTWVVCNGNGHYSDDTWSVQLSDMLVGSLKVDEDLLTAVPSSLAPPLRQLKYEGLVNVNGVVTIAGTNGTAAPSATQLAAYTSSANSFGGVRTANRIPTTPFREATTTMAWDLKLVMNQAKMMVGLPLENVFGTVRLIGQYDGQNAECRGELDIDSLTVYGSQITKLRGPIWMDNTKTAAGGYAQPFRVKPNRSNIDPLADPAAPPDSLVGVLHGGVVRFDAQMNSGPKGEFLVQATLSDGCLKTACREFGAEMDNIEGHSFAGIRLRGDYSGTHSHRGEGRIQLRGAEIYELPVFLSLLKILNVGPLTRTAFDSSNIDFTIHGENIVFERMEFLGDAISLIGNGKMNLDWEIDLNFYSVMGRGRIYIPLISELYRASSQKVLWINVNGTLDDPKTNRQWLPELSDSLRQLVQPPEGSAFNNPNGILAPTSAGSTNDSNALEIELPDFSETDNR